MRAGWAIGGVSYAESSPLCLSASAPRSCGQGIRGEGDLEIPGFWTKSGFKEAGEDSCRWRPGCWGWPRCQSGAAWGMDAEGLGGSVEARSDRAPGPGPVGRGV